MIIDGKFVINGEVISPEAVMTFVQALYNDAQTMAGEFHNMNRSVKFRKNWPNEYRFAKSEWRNFIEATRAMYVEMIGRESTPDHEKMRMFKALVLEKDVSDLLQAEGREADTRLQIAKGTEGFEGSKEANEQIVDDFGETQNARAVVADALQTLH